MDAAELAFAGPARQAELVRAGEVSARDLVQIHLERIERIDPQLNCFRTVMAERALAEAEQADARRAAGEQRPLLGVPMAVKDNVDVAGEVTANGAEPLGPAATADAQVVARLRAAGAVVVGKTTLPELAVMGTTEGPAFGVTRNPWDVERTPGGSSGGSAAAVAAGLVPAAHASDGAGSIRIPAANCGLFGLKPQRGRVSLAPDTGHWHGMSVFGALTRTVLDGALMLDVLAGPAAGDPDALPPPARPFVEAARSPWPRLKVALSFRGLVPVAIDAEVRAAVQDTADLLRSLGHDVRELDPAYNEIGSVFVPRFLGGIADEAATMARPDRLQRRTRGFVRLGRAIPRALIAHALRDEARQARRINRVLDDCDVLLTPVTAVPPLGAAEWEGRGALRSLLGMTRAYPFTGIWNATGQPAAAIPAGFTASGLPLAAQLIGRPAAEDTLIGLAAELEAERPWAERRPPVA